LSRKAPTKLSNHPLATAPIPVELLQFWPPPRQHDKCRTENLRLKLLGGSSRLSMEQQSSSP